jgi:hypothetical protein
VRAWLVAILVAGLGAIIFGGAVGSAPDLIELELVRSAAELMAVISLHGDPKPGVLADQFVFVPLYVLVLLVAVARFRAAARQIAIACMACVLLLAIADTVENVVTLAALRSLHAVDEVEAWIAVLVYATRAKWALAGATALILALGARHVACSAAFVFGLGGAAASFVGTALDSSKVLAAGMAGLAGAAAALLATRHRAEQRMS